MKQCLNCHYFRFVGLRRYCAHAEHVRELTDPARRCLGWIEHDRKFISPGKAEKISLEKMLGDYHISNSD